jgi:dTMP kinase
MITIEGIDGTGKTTLAAALGAALSERGVEVRVLREPGGVPAAERVRELVKDPGLRIGARAEALLYAAARAQLVEESIRPMLEAGTWVILDRFVDSSLAYQGGGRELGIEAVGSINEFATGGLVPDLTLLLVAGADVARSRAGARAEPTDRHEAEQDDFFERTSATYERLHERDGRRIRKLDAAEPPERVLAAAIAALADLLGERSG